MIPKFVINTVMPVPFSDVDECENADLNECAEHTTCINQPGSYNCKCAPGFKPTGNEDSGIKTRCEGEVSYTLKKVISHKKRFWKNFIDILYYDGSAGVVELRIYPEARLSLLVSSRKWEK